MLCRSSENRLLVKPQPEWNKWSCKLYLQEKVQLDHSSKNQLINIPSISQQLMADPGYPIQLQLSAQNGGVKKTNESMFYFTQKIFTFFHSELMDRG